VNYLAEIAMWSILGFGVLLFVLQMLAREAGFWAGRRSRRGAGEAEGVGVMVGALLALLSFVLALTLSFANTRFDERRVGTLAEANAIGTAWLRAEALGQPRGDEIARLLQEYAKLRRDDVVANRDSKALIELNQRISALQNEIWGHVMALTREQPNPITGQLQSSVNDVFDETTSERFAIMFRLPPQIVWLLLGLALLAMAALGYQLGLRERPFRTIATILTIAWTLVIVDILDLGATRIGTFRTNPQAYDWTLSSMQTPPQIPPVPAQPR
jgi:hypothetical protein